MRSFRDKEFHILVSTTVIEVGVDIPNAAVMMIEGANRFGLAQLHQLRGRVGRSENQAICLLIPDTEDSLENERLMVMTETNDGFVLAEKDLEQRGPGDFIGYRQSGFADLRMASITDIRLIEKARGFAQELYDSDPLLAKPENELLLNKLSEFWKVETSDIS
jgi:ATP-dependent DNA helicase RecG